MCSVDRSDELARSLTIEPRRFGVNLGLCACLSIDRSRALERKTAQPLGGRGWESVFVSADLWRLESALVDSIAVNNLAPPVPAFTFPDGRMTVTAALAQRRIAHRERRDVLAARLTELVQALNTEGIVPILIKGSRSIWLGSPEWRSMRDLDLLVAGHDATRAQAIAVGLGYTTEGGPERRGSWHHRPNLYRPDLPGWLEFHNRGGVPRVEQFIGTAELVAEATEQRSPFGRALLLPPHLHVLHGLVHHHVGHGADKRGEIDLKGLYEFAAEVALLTAEEIHLLVARAGRHPRLSAMMDLWTAGSADLFGLEVRDPLILRDDATEWWQRVRSQTNNTEPVTSKRIPVADETAVACSPGRLRRAPYGIYWAGRLAWRVAIATSFVQRPALLPVWG